jgi:hypothetical protein
MSCDCDSVINTERALFLWYACHLCLAVHVCCCGFRFLLLAPTHAQSNSNIDSSTIQAINARHLPCAVDFVSKCAACTLEYTIAKHALCVCLTRTRHRYCVHTAAEASCFAIANVVGSTCVSVRLSPNQSCLNTYKRIHSNSLGCIASIHFALTVYHSSYL